MPPAPGWSPKLLGSGRPLLESLCPRPSLSGSGGGERCGWPPEGPRSSMVSYLSCVCVLITSSYKDTGHWVPVTSLELNFFFKDPLSKYNHILRFWGLGRKHWGLGEYNSAQNHYLTLLFKILLMCSWQISLPLSLRQILNICQWNEGYRGNSAMAPGSLVL